jgi:hypothetical protein
LSVHIGQDGFLKSFKKLGYETLEFYYDDYLNNISVLQEKIRTLKYTSMTYCLVPKLLLGNAYSYGNLVKRDRVDLLEHWYYFDTEIRVVF